MGVENKRALKEERNATMKIPTLLFLGFAAILVASAQDASPKETSQLEKLEMMMNQMADITKEIEEIKAKKDAPKAATEPASAAKDETKKAEEAPKPAPAAKDEEKKSGRKSSHTCQR